MPDQGNTKILYDNLITSGKLSDKEIGDFSTFREMTKDSAQIDRLYENLRKDDLFNESEIGNKESFLQLLSTPSVSKIDPETTPETTPTKQKTATFGAGGGSMYGWGGSINRGGNKPEVTGLEGTGKELRLKATRGAHSFNKWLADTPDFINRNIIEIFVNRSNIGRSIRTTGKIAEVLGFKEIAAKLKDWRMEAIDLRPEKYGKFIEDQKAMLTKRIAELNPKHEMGIMEAAKAGDWVTFTRNLAGGVAESFAPSLAMMITGGAMGAAGMIAGGTAVFGAAKYDELDKLAPDMPEGQKILISDANGALEGIFETLLGSGAVGRALVNIVTKSGRKVAQKTILDGFRQGFADIITRYPALAPLGEGFEEWATEVSQNYVDKISGYRPDINIFERSMDALLIGVLAGATHTTALTGAKLAMDMLENPDNVAPFSKFSPRTVDKERRERQGFVAVTRDEEGNAWELIEKDGKVIGLSPTGKVNNNLSQETIAKAENLDVEAFYNFVEQARQTGNSIDQLWRDAQHQSIAGNVRRNINVYKNLKDGKVHIWRDDQEIIEETGEPKEYFIIEETEDGMAILTDREGNRRIESITKIKPGTEVYSEEDIINEATKRFDEQNPVEEVNQQPDSFIFNGKPHTIQEVTPEGVWIVSEVDKHLNPVGKVHKLTSEEQEAVIEGQQEDPEATPDIRIIKVGGNEYQLKPTDDGGYSVEGVEGEAEARQVAEDIMSVTEGKADVEIIQVTKGDFLSPGTYSVKVTERPAPVTDEITEPSYLFNDEEISKEDAEALIMEAETEEELKGLNFKNDEELEALKKEKFAVPDPVYKVGNKKITRAQAKAKIRLGKTEGLKVQNDSELEDLLNKSKEKLTEKKKEVSKPKIVKEIEKPESLQKVEPVKKTDDEKPVDKEGLGTGTRKVEGEQGPDVKDNLPVKDIGTSKRTDVDLSRGTDVSELAEGKVSEKKPVKFNPRTAAKDLIKAYVLRGESQGDLSKSYLGVHKGDYSASIGGYIDGKKIPTTKIIVDQINNKKITPEIFSLNELYNEIKEEQSAIELQESIVAKTKKISKSKEIVPEVKQKDITLPVEESKVSELKQAEAEVDQKPTEEQKKAGNYKKGHVKIGGFDITIENPVGSTRSGTDESGKKWSIELKNTYGYFKRTKGKDGDQIDVFLGDNLNSDKVFVIDQVDPGTGKFDEHKVMFGFNNEANAREAYLKNYEPGWKGIGAITALSIKEFKKWLNVEGKSNRRKRKPVSELVSLKTIPEQPTDREAEIDWIVDYSKNPNEIYEAFQEEETKTEYNNLTPKEQHVLGNLITEDSWDRFADKNNLTGAIKLTWMVGAKKGRKPPVTIDQISQSWSMENKQELTEKEIVNIIKKFPSNRARTTTDLMRHLRKAYRDETGMTINNHVPITKEVELIEAKLEKYIEDFNVQYFTEEDILESLQKDKDKLIENDYIALINYIKNEIEGIKKARQEKASFLETEDEEGEPGIQREDEADEAKADEPRIISPPPKPEVVSPQQELINKAEKELKSLNSQLATKKKEIDDRHGIFGDAGVGMTKMFGSEAFNLVNAQEVVEGLKAEIIRKEQEIADLIKRKEIGEKEAKGQQELIIPEQEVKEKEVKPTKEPTKEYKYHLSLRPFDIGTYPKEGFVRFEDDGSQFGSLVYSGQVSLKEIKHYSLVPITEAEELDKKIVYSADYPWKLELKKDSRGTYYFDVIQYDEGEEVDRASLTVEEVLSNIKDGSYTLNKPIPDVLLKSKPTELTPDRDYLFKSGLTDPTKLKTKEDVADYNARVEIMNKLYDEGFLGEDFVADLEEEWVLSQIGEKRYFSEIVEEKFEELPEDFNKIIQVKSASKEIQKLIDKGVLEPEPIKKSMEDWLDPINIPIKMSIEDLIIQSKGLTDDLNEAGYILQDGRLLDFSGKRVGGQQGSRVEDHRQLAIPYKESFKSPTDAMNVFMRETGAIRIDNNTGAIDIETEPTLSQEKIISKIIRNNLDTWTIDLQEDERKLSLQGGPMQMALNNIERFFTDKTLGTGYNDIILLKSEPFYSPTERALSKIKQKKGTVEQFKSMLLKNGAKPAEMDWMDFDGTFAGKTTITTEDVQQWIDQNKVEVEEITISKDKIKTDQQEWERLNDLVTDAESKGLSKNKISKLESNRYIFENLMKTKVYKEPNYIKYQVPGGENYKELLLTMPGKAEELWKDHAKYVKELQEKYKTFDVIGLDNKMSQDEKIKLAAFVDIADQLPKSFKSLHFDEPNILAHIRFNERLDSEGNKVLFIEELQSDWAQEGRKEGFKEFISKKDIEVKYFPREKGQDPDIYPGHWESYDKRNNEMITRHAGWWTESEVIQEAFKYASLKQKERVPQMPFKKTDQWINLAMRRMIRYAAENGFDKIAWTTGEMQVERYDLSKQVDRIHYFKRNDGKTTITAFLDGKEILAQVVDNNKLDEVVGKDIAKKIIDSDTHTDSLKGDDLKVGGEGMKAFYDKILPGIANKLGKKFGSKVEPVIIETGVDEKENEIIESELSDGTFAVEYAGEQKEFKTEQEAAEYASSLVNKKQQVQSLPINKEMFTTALGEGFPLFKDIRDYDTPLDYFNEVFNQSKINYEKTKVIAEKLSNKLNTSIKVVRTKNELPEVVRKIIKKLNAKIVYGTYTPTTDEVFLVSDDLRGNERLATETVLHEIVGHKGLRELLGNDYISILDMVYNGMNTELRSKYINTYGSNSRLIADEYLADMASMDKKPSLWNRVIAKLRELLRRLFPNLTMRNSEVVDLLRKSKKKLEEGKAESVKSKSIIETKLAIQSDKTQTKAFKEKVGDTTIKKLLEIESIYGNLPKEKIWTEFGISDKGNQFGKVQGVNRHFQTIADYLIAGFNGLGFEYSLKNTAKSGTTYVERDGGFSVRISDHIGRGGIFTAAYDISTITEAKIIISNAYSKKELDELHSNEKIEAEKRNIIRDEFTEMLKNNGYGTKVNDRTYQTFLEFSNKHPEIRDIMQTPLTKGAFRYEYLAPLDEYTKPASNEYMEWYNKSINNLGAFDPLNSNIRLKSDISKLSDSKSEKQVTTFQERVREILQDNMLALKKWQKEIQTDLDIEIRDFENAYQKENLYHGKVLDKMDLFTRNEGKQLIGVVSNFMKVGKLTLKEVQRYLVASHGPERNEYFWEQDEDNQGKDFAGLTELRSTVLLEMEDRTESLFMAAMSLNDFARYYTNLIERKSGSQAAEELRRAVNQATDFTLKQWEEAGFISKEDLKTYMSRYSYYVPLRGWDVTDEFDYSSQVGEYSSPIKRTRGRKTLADDPLSYIMNMANTAVIAGERNKIKRAMSNLVRNNRKKLESRVKFSPTYFVKTGQSDSKGNPIIYETIDRPEQILFDEGKVSTKIPREYKQRKTPAQAKEFEVELYENGKKLILVFEGSDPAISRSINNRETSLGIDSFNKAINTPIIRIKVKGKIKTIIPSIGSGTRFIASVLTSRNPAFVIPNMMRDIPLAILSEYVHGDTKDAAIFFKNLKIAEGAIRRSLRGKPDLKNPIDIKYVQFKAHGGPTGYVHLKSADVFKKELLRDINSLSNEVNVAVSMAKGFRIGIGYIEQLSEWSENLSRFAVYLGHIDKGETPEASAFAAKQSTVNFNKKGRLSPTLNGLFAFFNASIQAADKYFKMWGTNWKKMAAIHSVLMVQGFMSALLLDLFGDEDDEGIRQYDKVNDFIKSNYLVIPIPYTDRIVTIPMPHVLRAFHGIGIKTYDLMTNRTTPIKAITDVLSNIPQDLLPIDGGGILDKQGDLSIKPLTPTILKPLIEIIMNENFMGIPIVPEPFTIGQRNLIADTKKSREHVNDMAKKFTEGLYRLGGGDETGYKLIYKNGELHEIPALFDISPETIEHLFGSYLGGTGLFFNNIYKTTGNVLEAGNLMLKGEEFREAIEEINLNSVPVLHRFLRQAWGDPLKSAYYDAKRDLDTKVSIMKKHYDNRIERESRDKYFKMQKEIGFDLKRYKIYQGRIEYLNEKYQQLLGADQEESAEMVDKAQRQEMQKIIKLQKDE